MRANKVPKWKQKLAGEKPLNKISEFTDNKEKYLQVESNAYKFIVHKSDYCADEITLKQDIFEDYVKSILVEDRALIEMLVLRTAPDKQPQTQPPQDNQIDENVLHKIVMFIKPTHLKQQRSDISILKDICDVHSITESYFIQIRRLEQQEAPLVFPMSPQNYMMPQLPNQRIPNERIVGYAELSFKDQFVSRRDQWRITQQLHMMSAYKTKFFEIEGIRVRVRTLFDNGKKEVLNGILDISKTKFIFFSKSTQVSILIEASADMYQFDHNGHLQTEKAVAFVKSYFDRCLRTYCSDEVQIVIYSRLYYPQVRSEQQLKEELKKHHGITEYCDSSSYFVNLGAFFKSKHVKYFQDIYLKIGTFEITKHNAEKAVMAVKRALNFVPSLVNWCFACPTHVQEMKEAYPHFKFSKQPLGSLSESPQLIPCQVGTSEKSQILEAINLSLFNLNNENMDQNLKKTGHQLILLIAGNGSFRVNADMVLPTKSRTLLGGTHVQIVSLAQRPPFQTPLLIRCCTYENPFETHRKYDKAATAIKPRKRFRRKSPKIIESRQTHHNMLKDQSNFTLSPPNNQGNDDFYSMQSQHPDFLSPTEEDITHEEQSSGSDPEQETSDLKKSKKRYFLLNWIDIVYLFDIRLIESNLYLQAASFETSQPADALHLIDKSLTFSFGDEREKFIESKYFDVLKEQKVRQDLQIEILNKFKAKVTEAYKELGPKKGKDFLVVQQNDYLLEKSDETSAQDLSKIFNQFDSSQVQIKTKMRPNPFKLSTQTLYDPKSFIMPTNSQLLHQTRSLINMSNQFRTHLLNIRNKSDLFEKDDQRADENVHAYYPKIPKQVDFFKVKSLQNISHYENPAGFQGGKPTMKDRFMNMINEENSIMTSQLEMDKDSEVSKAFNASSLPGQTPIMKQLKKQQSSISNKIGNEDESGYPGAFSKLKSYNQLPIEQDFKMDSNRTKRSEKPAFIQAQKNTSNLDASKVTKNDQNQSQINLNTERPSSFYLQKSKETDKESNKEDDIFFKENRQRIQQLIEPLQFDSGSQERRQKAIPFNRRQQLIQLSFGKPGQMDQQIADAEGAYKQYKLNANRRRWTHSHVGISQIDYQFYTNQQVINLLRHGMTRGKQAEAIEFVFANFWKNITECRLLPITTDFYPDDKMIDNPNKYRCDPITLDKPENGITMMSRPTDFLNEFLGLRFTQNMQIYSPQGLCYFDQQTIRTNKLNLKLGIGNMHHQLEQIEETKFNFKSFVRQNHDDISNEMSAKFRYLLFDYYTNSFEIKISQESRLFNFKSISNIDETLHEFVKINELCTKVPQQHFLLIPQRSQEPPYALPTPEKLAQNLHLFKEQLIEMLTNKSTSRINSVSKVSNQLNLKIDPNVSLDLNHLQCDMATRAILSSPIAKFNVFVDQMVNKNVSGAYTIECDKNYYPRIAPCFHIRFFWIFATSIQMTDSIKAIQRRAQKCDFDMTLVSGLIHNNQLNPFENNIVIRKDESLEYLLQEQDHIMHMQLTNRFHQQIEEPLVKENEQESFVIVANESEQSRRQSEKPFFDLGGTKKGVLNVGLISPIEKQEKQTLQTYNQIRSRVLSEDNPFQHRVNQISQPLQTLFENHQELHYPEIDQNSEGDTKFLNNRLSKVQIAIKIKQNKLFHRLFMRVIQQPFIGFVKESVLIRSKPSSLDTEVGFFTTVPSKQNMYLEISFIHQSGLCLVSINDQTGDVAWHENDVFFNGITMNTQMNALKQVIGNQMEQQTLWNLNNNDYSLSKALRSKVDASMVAAEILAEIFAKCDLSLPACFDE